MIKLFEEFCNSLNFGSNFGSINEAINPKLVNLDISGNNIPAEIIAEFQEALPNCEIYS